MVAPSQLMPVPQMSPSRLSSPASAESSGGSLISAAGLDTGVSWLALNGTAAGWGEGSGAALNPSGWSHLVCTCTSSLT